MINQARELRELCDALAAALARAEQAERERNAMMAELQEALSVDEAVGDALDAAVPGWEGDYPDAIARLARERDAAREALKIANDHMHHYPNVWTGVCQDWCPKCRMDAAIDAAREAERA